MKNVKKKKPVEEIKSHILCSVILFFQNGVVNEITWNNTVQLGRPQMTIWRMRVACCIPKDTNIFSEYVVLIAFQCNNGYSNAPQRYVICTWPVWFLYLPDEYLQSFLLDVKLLLNID